MRASTVRFYRNCANHRMLAFPNPMTARTAERMPLFDSFIAGGCCFSVSRGGGGGGWGKGIRATSRRIGVEISSSPMVAGVPRQALYAITTRCPHGRAHTLSPQKFVKLKAFRAPDVWRACWFRRRTGSAPETPATAGRRASPGGLLGDGSRFGSAPLLIPLITTINYSQKADQ